MIFDLAGRERGREFEEEESRGRGGGADDFADGCERGGVGDGDENAFGGCIH
jgi:hypothetical protein